MAIRLEGRPSLLGWRSSLLETMAQEKEEGSNIVCNKKFSTMSLKILIQQQEASRLEAITTKN